MGSYKLSVIQTEGFSVESQLIYFTVFRIALPIAVQTVLYHLSAKEIRGVIGT